MIEAHTGIGVGDVFDTFDGGITNAGTISGVNNGAGVSIDDVAASVIDITNSGFIAGRVGIVEFAAASTPEVSLFDTGEISGSYGDPIRARAGIR